MPTVEQLKSEISDQYLEKFKEQLGGVKSLVLFPIQEEVKKILIGQIDLPEKFDEVKEFGWWKNIINFIAPSIANQIFAFMKEKRIEIETRKTEEELLQLKQEIVSGQHPFPDSDQSVDQKNSDAYQEKGESHPSIVQNNSQNQNQIQKTPSEDTLPKKNSSSEDENNFQEKKESQNSAAIGLATSVGGVAAVTTMSKLSSSLEKQTLAKNLTPEQMRSNIYSALENLKARKSALSSRMSKKQIKSLDNHINKLSDGLSNIDNETPELLKLRDSMRNKLPREALVTSGLDAKTLTKIEKISEDLLGKSSDEIRMILKNNNIQNVGDEMIEAFSKATSKTELGGMCRLLKHGSKINRAIQTLSGMMLVDVACLGFDVRMYIETNKEAELIKKVNELRAKNKQNQAITQLGIGLSSVALELLLACTVAGSTGGPLGTVIGIGIGAVSAAASIGVDTLYFDVKDFYLQNKEDFIHQKKSQLNQVILQGLHNQKKGNTSLNEKLGTPEANQKSQSFQDAVWARLFVDELENGSLSSSQLLFSYLESGETRSAFIAKLSDREKKTFEEDRKKVENIIKQRLIYLKPFFQGDVLIEKLKNGGGMQELNTLIDQSRVYQTLISQNKRNEKLDFSQNITQYKKEFFSEFSQEKLAKLENIKQKNPDLYQEILVTVDLNSLLSEDENNSSFSENVKLVKKMQDRIRLTEGEKLFQLKIPDSNKNVKFMENLLYVDFDITKVQYPSIKFDEVREIIQQRGERRGNLNIADDPMQNVLYKLANQLYGYTGANTEEELMAFYSEGLGAVQGIYFSDEWKLNEDWRKDYSLKTQIPSNFPRAELDTKVDAFCKSKFGVNLLKQITLFCLSGGGLLGGAAMVANRGASTIDTPTEAIDDDLQKEFESKLRAILKEELSYRTIEHKQEVKNQISAFVSKNAKNGNYVELPYYLLLQAKKAGLGDLQRQFFTRKNNKLETLFLKSELNDQKSLDTQATYLTHQRESYSEQEQGLIARVESAHKKLEALRSITSSFSHEDELDLPKSIEILISNKYKEREKFKSDTLYYDVNSFGASEMIEKYHLFARYFEDLYFGILLSLTTFKSSNDIDNFGTYTIALQYGAGGFFNETGAIDNAKVENLEFLKNIEIQKFYSGEIKKQRIGKKTIEELRKSGDRKEKELGLQASKIILSTMIEKSLITEDKIKIGGNRADSDALSSLSDTTQLSSLISARLKSITNVSHLDQNKIQNQIKNKGELKSLTQPQKKVIQQTNPLQKKIEATKENVVWQGKRGDIVYDPQYNTLKSRGQTIKLESKGAKLKLPGYNYELEVQDALWLANFANWAKNKYRGKTIAFEIEGMHDALVAQNADKKRGASDDIEIISQDTLIQFCPFFDDDQDESKVKSLAEWLSKHIR